MAISNEKCDFFGHSVGNEVLLVAVPSAPGAFALRVDGESVATRYTPGDRVIFRPLAPDELKSGDDAMIQLDGEHDGKGTFKRVFVTGVKLLLVPLNNGHKTAEVRLVKVIRAARAIWVCRPV